MMLTLSAVLAVSSTPSGLVVLGKPGPVLTYSDTSPFCTDATTPAVVLSTLSQFGILIPTLPASVNSLSTLSITSFFPINI